MAQATQVKQAMDVKVGYGAIAMTEVDIKTALAELKKSLKHIKGVEGVGIRHRTEGESTLVVNLNRDRFATKKEFDAAASKIPKIIQKYYTVEVSPIVTPDFL